MHPSSRKFQSARRKARGHWPRAFFLAVIFITLTSYAGAQVMTHPMQHNGYNRPYLVYRPARLPANPAVVFMLVGIRSTAESEAKEFGWTEEADRNGFVVVFPEPVATRADQPMDRKNNVTFWEMEGSRTHVLASGAQPVDDDGYLLAVMHDVIRREGVDRHRIFWAGFSSGSGMVQLFASRHAKEISAIAAAATPLMHPPARLDRPVPVLYLHGDDDEQFSGFETNSPNFATTPHGNWVTWGYLDGCQMQTVERTEWGVRFTWKGCKDDVPVIADFFKGLGHEWPGSSDSNWNAEHRPGNPIEFTELAWQFFSTIQLK